MIRIFDIFFSLIGLVFGLPVLLVIWTLGVFDTGSPIFRQERVGRNMKSFTLVKFRTMSRGSPSLASHLISGSSITTYGRFLRKTKLDELPQLWNVLIGDMSLVGPRPEVPHYVERYSDEMKRVLAVRPGLTDPASLNGFDEGALLDAADDPERHYAEVVMPQKVAMQLDYIDRANAFSDLMLVARTLLRIFKGG